MRGGWMITGAFAMLMGLSACAAPPANQLGSGCPNSGPYQPTSSQLKGLNCEGKYYLHKGKYQHAVDNFTAAIAIDPSNPKDFYNRSLALRALGRTDEANADLAHAHQMDPNLPPN